MRSHSALIGDFSFRPKAYHELSREESVAMLDAPDLRTFIVALRAADDSFAKSTSVNAVTEPTAHPIAFSLSAEEMLRRTRTFVILPSPP